MLNYDTKYFRYDIKQSSVHGGKKHLNIYHNIKIKTKGTPVTIIHLYVN